MAATLRLAMLGFGNVGRELTRILVERGDDIHARTGARFTVTGIHTRTRGTLVDPRGVDLSRALQAVEAGGTLAGTKALTSEEFIESCPSDTVLELTTLDPMTAQPATTHIEMALAAGRHVVTANKGPIAWHYRRLESLARQHGVRLLFESTVMDGTPVFNMARHCLAGCRVLAVRGILNSTTNVILDYMERGMTFDQGLKRAQETGSAEADPSLDIDGWDAAAKIAALMNVLMDVEITPPDVKREGIRGIDPERIARAKSSGNVIKLLCEGTSLGARVGPAELPCGHPFAGVTGSSSVVSIETDLMGEITIVENNPGTLQTAYGVLNDLIEIANPPRGA